MPRGVGLERHTSQDPDGRVCSVRCHSHEHLSARTGEPLLRHTHAFLVLQGLAGASQECRTHAPPTAVVAQANLLRDVLQRGDDGRVRCDVGTARRCLQVVRRLKGLAIVLTHALPGARAQAARARRGTEREEDKGQCHDTELFLRPSVLWLGCGCWFRSSRRSAGLQHARAPCACGRRGEHAHGCAQEGCCLKTARTQWGKRRAARVPPASPAFHPRSPLCAGDTPCIHVAAPHARGGADGRRGGIAAFELQELRASGLPSRRGTGVALRTMGRCACGGGAAGGGNCHGAYSKAASLCGRGESVCGALQRGAWGLREQI